MVLCSSETSLVLDSILAGFRLVAAYCIGVRVSGYIARLRKLALVGRLLAWLQGVTGRDVTISVWYGAGLECRCSGVDVYSCVTEQEGVCFVKCWCGVAEPLLELDLEKHNVSIIYVEEPVTIAGRHYYIRLYVDEWRVECTNADSEECTMVELYSSIPPQQTRAHPAIESSNIHEYCSELLPQYLSIANRGPRST